MTKFTSVNDGHRHTWNPKKRNTSWNDGHKHRIDLKKLVAIRGKTGHTHKLLR